MAELEENSSKSGEALEEAELDANEETTDAKGDSADVDEEDDQVIDLEASNDQDDSQEEKSTPTKENKDEEIIIVDDSVDAKIATKTVSDSEFFSSVSDEEKDYYERKGVDAEQIDNMNINCTACSKQVNHHIRNTIMRHPSLGVPVCRSCKEFYEDDGVWEKDEQGSDSYCRWCANGGEMVCCDKCTNAFCKQCIQRNLGRASFNKINDAEYWECFSCDPTPIFPQRALMFAISKWYVLRKERKKVKDKEAKQKLKEKTQQSNLKKMTEELKSVENFIDDNMNEAFDTLKIYQKCLEDEQKRWIRMKKAMNPDGCASIVTKLRKIYAITKQNMELLDAAILQGYTGQFPDQNVDRLRPGRIPASSPKTKKVEKPAPPPPGRGANGVAAAGVNKRKMKITSKGPAPDSAKKTKTDDDDDIAVEEIVVNGDPVFGAPDYLDPSQLCSVQITGIAPPAAPRIPPVHRPGGPLRISSKMFKKKSPTKRPATPDSDIEEILIDDEDGDGVKPESDDIDSDVSLEC